MTLTCTNCESSFIVSIRTCTRKYCSDTCRKAAAVKRAIVWNKRHWKAYLRYNRNRRRAIAEYKRDNV